MAELSVAILSQTPQAAPPRSANHRQVARIRHGGRASGAAGRSRWDSTRSITPQLRPVHCAQAPWTQALAKRMRAAALGALSMKSATKHAALTGSPALRLGR